MKQFFDQNNPEDIFSNNSRIEKIRKTRAIDSRTPEERELDSIFKRRRENTSSFSQSNEERLKKQVELLIERSAPKEKQINRVNVIKKQKEKPNRKKLICALLVSCLILGGVATAAIDKVIDNISEGIVMYEQMSDFRTEVIIPNTHRTDNNKYFFYDYSNIADAIMEDGKDFSTELYKTYIGIGQTQTNRVMKYTNYSSLESYVSACGFENIDDWAKCEKRKIVLQNELENMHKEVNNNRVLNDTEDTFVGGK